MYSTGETTIMATFTGKCQVLSQTGSKHQTTDKVKGVHDDDDDNVRFSNEQKKTNQHTIKHNSMHARTGSDSYLQVSGLYTESKGIKKDLHPNEHKSSKSTNTATGHQKLQNSRSEGYVCVSYSESGTTDREEGATKSREPIGDSCVNCSVLQLTEQSSKNNKRGEKCLCNELTLITASIDIKRKDGLPAIPNQQTNSGKLASAKEKPNLLIQEQNCSISFSPKKNGPQTGATLSDKNPINKNNEEQNTLQAVIQDNYTSLVHNPVLDARELSDHLYEGRIISLEEYNRIFNKIHESKSKTDENRFFLMFLSTLRIDKDKMIEVLYKSAHYQFITVFFSDKENGV
ncbi:hypothetical protein MAR_013407 [Mya arenaria]|uniref:Uncharacterized protein n=1 Tax=Mya arenaria TaxID=6604 RepID=A0ABY7FZR5_MYAAR|nr:uncharacterized protein LOC128220175 [Mya arenaria]WAR27703.1 hypothetical protein MAR_013407 [Mya arenaria]